MEERPARRPPRHRTRRRPPAAGYGLLPHEAAHVLAAHYRLLDFRPLLVREGHQAALGEIPVGTQGGLAHVFLDELVEPRDDAAVRVLDVDEQRPRNAVVAARDGLEGGLHRSEARRVGKEWCSYGRSRWVPYH